MRAAIESPGGEIEAARFAAQQRLDLARPQRERNRRGQFATPVALASAILQFARACTDTPAVRFLDPAIGTGVFYSALRSLWRPSQISAAVGFEVDAYYGEACRVLWAATPLRVRGEDFTLASAPRREVSRYDLIICNPPYVRHHHLTAATKASLRRKCLSAADVELNGRCGLYVYFLLLAHAWMARGALAGWLIPSEFMDVNYGAGIRQYLSRHVTLLRIHRFEPTEMQFGDATVSSAIVWFRNVAPPTGHRVEFSLGGSLHHPRRRGLVSASELQASRKWSEFPTRRPGMKRGTRRASGRTQCTLGELFRIQRGIATGANRFFVMTPQQAAQRSIPTACLRPILPRPRYLEVDEIAADESGRPLLAHELLLLDCQLTEAQVRERYPALWHYLELGREQYSHGYLCSRRSPWYAQEVRAPTSFLCSYIARGRKDGRLHRFIFNRTAAIASNSYLMLYPRAALAAFIGGDITRARRVWQTLCEIKPQAMRSAGRMYGGGMHKLEPTELASICVPALAALLSA